MPSVAWSASVACPYWRRPSSSFTFLVLTSFFRGLSCRSVNRTAGKAKKEMLNFKEKQARKGRTAHADEKDKPGGQAWLPVVLPSDGKSWGKNSRTGTFAEITESLEPPEGAKKIKRQKSASFHGVPLSAKLSKSERKRKQTISTTQRPRGASGDKLGI